MENSLVKILLDMGGSVYGDRTEPSFPGLDGNSFLARLGQVYTEYLTDRVAIESLVSRLGEPLTTSGWFTPVGYRYYDNDPDNEWFVGSVTERMKLAQEAKIDLVVRLHITESKEDSVLVGYYSVGSECLAVTLAEELNSLEHTPFDTIDVVQCNSHGSTILEREIAQELRLAPAHGVVIYLGLTPEGNFINFLGMRQGELWLVSSLSRAFDKISKELRETE